MRYLKLKGIVDKKLKEHGINGIKFIPSFYAKKKEGGVTVATTRIVSGTKPVIVMNIFFMLLCTFDLTRRTALHEVAHVIDFYKNPSKRENNHGSSWKKIAEKLGVKPECVSTLEDNLRDKQVIRLISKLTVS